jgi:hypothetical protein
MIIVRHWRIEVNNRKLVVAGLKAGERTLKAESSMLIAGDVFSGVDCGESAIHPTTWKLT